MTSNIMSSVDDTDTISESTPLLNEFENPNSTKKWREIIICLLIYSAPLSAGLALGYSGGTIAVLSSSGILNSEEASWFASILNVGAALGGLLGGLFADKYGRKSALLLLSAPMTFGFIILALPSPIPQVMIFGRFLTGIGVGMTCMCTPTYIAEITSKNLRGVLGTGFQLSISFGLFLAYLIWMFLKDYIWLAIICAFSPFILVFTALFIPESPIWLVSNGFSLDALNALITLRGDIHIAEMELTKLTENLLKSQNESSDERGHFMKRSICAPIFISLALMAIQQFGGINAILFYSSEIFEKAGYLSDSNLETTIIGAVMFVATIFASFLIEKIGRKALLIISVGGLCLCCVSMGIYYYLKEKEIADVGGLSLGSLIGYICFFSIGSGPLPWLMMSELMPRSVKAKASAVATFFNWMCSFLVTKIWFTMKTYLHSYGAFCVFACCNLLGLIFVIFFVPETKGRTLEEIESTFSNKSENKRSQNDYHGF